MSTEKKSQARLAAEAVLKDFWFSQVEKVANSALLRQSITDRDCGGVTLYPPTKKQYDRAEELITHLMTQPTSELAVAVSDGAASPAQEQP